MKLAPPLLLLLWPVSAFAADDPAAAADAFYAVYKDHHAQGGIPDATERVRYSPVLSPRLNKQLAAADAAQGRLTAKVKNAVPPMLEGDIFSSLFEGATSWKVGACQGDAKTARCPVALSYVPPPNAKTNKPANWNGSLSFWMRLDPDGQLPRDLDAKLDLTGVAGNFWLGLALLHTLFTREHNAIADRLAAEHRDWTDDELFAKARLITAGLMAKIHTVEWTPAIIAHPTTKFGMRANWYGILGKRLGKRSSNEVLGGIPGSATSHHGVPYSLTEEFVAVYRMHPLLPDDFTFRSIATDEVVQERTFRELGVNDVRARLDEVGFDDAFYSFGIAHPGAITLHNYPRFLQELHKPDGTVVDLAALDVLRIRERGVPRYNEFRRLFHLKPAATFEELTDNPKWARELREVYGDVEQVDLMVGLYAEPLPNGFGFSDTAFRVFILMASRRLKSDRFFTRDYNAETYTQTGLDWIDETSMSDVLLRHYPGLEPALRGVDNAFAPWKRVST